MSLHETECVVPIIQPSFLSQDPWPRQIRELLDDFPAIIVVLSLDFGSPFVCPRERTHIEWQSIDREMAQLIAASYSQAVDNGVLRQLIRFCLAHNPSLQVSAGIPEVQPSALGFA